MAHYSLTQKRAAVEIYHEAKKLKTEHHAPWLKPSELASVAAGGASRTQIFDWLKQDLSEGAQETTTEQRGSDKMLDEDQIHLLVGFVISQRSSHSPVSLETMRDFCTSHFGETPSLSTLSRTIQSFGFTSQKSMMRNSRLISEEVVDDALEAIEEIRSYDFPANRIIVMDETGLWSNVTQPKTYHFKNWYVGKKTFCFRNFFFEFFSKFLLIFF